MRVAVYSAKRYDRENMGSIITNHEMLFFEPRLDHYTAELAHGCEAACLFVNDDGSRENLELLAGLGVRFIALRSAGFNHIDLEAAEQLGLRVARVPGYSPRAVAEHTLALILALDRKIHRAYARVREGNFNLEGLLGFDLHLRTVGIVGTGRIGVAVAKILRGFGCRLLAHDVYHNPECLEIGVEYLSVDELFRQSDVVTLHCPLTPETKHIINSETLAKMKRGSMLINTSRGGLIDTAAAIDALKEGQLGYLGLDVYEEESDLFFEDLSDQVIQDDVFSRLLTFPNVIVTGHQAFFTKNALEQIAITTRENLDKFAAGKPSENDLHWSALHS